MRPRPKLVAHFVEPFVQLYTDVLRPFECEALIAAAQPRLARSTVLASQGGGSEAHGGRTSSGMFFRRGETELITEIEERLSDLMHFPVDHGEGLQVLRYEPGQHYLPHDDFFNPDIPGYNVHLKRGGQRVYTILLYLNDNFCCGETVFPRLNDFKVKPLTGAALVFRNITGEGRLEPRVFHGGNPPCTGTKYVATKWTRQSTF